MVLAITDIIMANTKIITRIDLRPAFVVLSIFLACLAAINLFSTTRPIARQNLAIASDVLKLDALDAPQHKALVASLLQKQQMLLSQNPADPYAWARLSY